MSNLRCSEFHEGGWWEPAPFYHHAPTTLPPFHALLQRAFGHAHACSLQRVQQLLIGRLAVCLQIRPHHAPIPCWNRLVLQRNKPSPLPQKLHFASVAVAVFGNREPHNILPVPIGTMQEGNRVHFGCPAVYAR